MLKPIHLRLFEKELVNAKKRGKDIEKLKKVMKLLTLEEPLPPKNRNHKLKGDYIGYWECHIEPEKRRKRRLSLQELVLIPICFNPFIFR